MTGSRFLIDVPLAPAIGSRFQPTGFPDIGAAEFQRPSTRPDGSTGWVACLLVESAQSMANRLEGMAWDSAINAPVPVVGGIPYVRVVAQEDGRYLTSSRVEAHRLASAFVKDSKLAGQSMVAVIGERLGLRDDTPTPQHHVARAIFALDPLCLIHGVFFADAKWPGQPKVARALTGFVEAIDVQRADSGGVKRDHVRHKLQEGAGGTSEGYGSVPFHRTEWTAAQLTASFSLDRRQLRSYGLGEAATALLESIALWEIRSLLDAGLRLRTACDLEPIDSDVIATNGERLPSLFELEGRIRNAATECRPMFAQEGALEVVWADGGSKKQKSGKTANDDDAEV
jgi:CRISPR-associated protein Csb1